MGVGEEGTGKGERIKLCDTSVFALTMKRDLGQTEEQSVAALGSQLLAKQKVLAPPQVKPAEIGRAKRKLVQEEGFAAAGREDRHG